LEPPEKFHSVGFRQSSHLSPAVIPFSFLFAADFIVSGARIVALTAARGGL
jgi:hypothetical protein